MIAALGTSPTESVGQIRMSPPLMAGTPRAWRGRVCPADNQPAQLAIQPATETQVGPQLQPVPARPNVHGRSTLRRRR